MTSHGSTKRQETGVRFDVTVKVGVGSTIRVLVADDNADVLMATADLVDEYDGFEVVSLAKNVDEAVRSAHYLQPDLALVDARLRGGGAFEATLRIRAVSPLTVVVALASAREPELVLRLREAGAAGCFEKESLSSLLPGLLSTGPR